MASRGTILVQSSARSPKRVHVQTFGFKIQVHTFTSSIILSRNSIVQSNKYLSGIFIHLNRWWYCSLCLSIANIKQNYFQTIYIVLRGRWYMAKSKPPQDMKGTSYITDMKYVLIILLEMTRRVVVHLQTTTSWTAINAVVSVMEQRLRWLISKLSSIDWPSSSEKKQTSFLLMWTFGRSNKFQLGRNLAGTNNQSRRSRPRRRRLMFAWSAKYTKSDQQKWCWGTIMDPYCRNHWSDNNVVFPADHTPLRTIEPKNRYYRKSPKMFLSEDRHLRLLLLK